MNIINQISINQVSCKSISCSNILEINSLESVNNKLLFSPNVAAMRMFRSALMVSIFKLKLRDCDSAYLTNWGNSRFVTVQQSLSDCHSVYTTVAAKGAKVIGP